MYKTQPLPQLVQGFCMLLMLQTFLMLDNAFDADVQHLYHSLAAAVQATAGLLQVGCLTSWSAYNTYLKQQPSGPDPVKQFAADFPTAAQLSSEDSTFDVRFPVFLLMCNNKT